MITKETLSTCALLFLFSACATTQTPTNLSEKDSSSYTSAFPSREVSKQLKRVQRSVLRISSQAIYTTYFFENKPLSLDEISNADLDEVATRKISENKGSAGTAIAISSSDDWGLMVTNHHVVHYPDTVLSYVKSENAQPKALIKAVAIKTDQSNLIFDSPHIGFFDVVSTNPRDDLALLEVNLKKSPNISFIPLHTKVGDSKDLKLASVLYIMGYPKGLPMVTRSIVSDPNRNSNGNFLTDALFNKGISGGIILASRNNFKSFEWVGMASSSYANAEYILVPDPMLPQTFDPIEIYDGELFVKRKTNLNYGITEAIPMQTILKFLRASKIQFYRRGMSLSKYN